MLGIMGHKFGPPDVGSLIPKRLIEEAGGLENFRTCACGEGLKIHRRIDDERVRRPVNGRRGFETVRLTSTKNDARDIHCESKGEFPLYCLLEMHASIELYRDQLDVVEIHDELGRTWACPDAFAILGRDQQPIWIEGKYATRLVRGPNNRKEVKHGINPKVESKLARLQRAFSRVGLSYVALNQSFCRSKTVADNVNRAFWQRGKVPTPNEIAHLKELLASGPLPVGDCLAAFSERAFPTDWLFAAIARGYAEYDLRNPYSLDSKVELPTGRPFWIEDPASEDHMERAGC
ncbi:hypothetical protein [Bradyrhizobium cosmicum]|uniref:hypothetical protein n=1 Tax=Bradyrhizobium cosmicum TaxID=1404864 RepID=UPI001165A401|nr:hypothetical protein [Bradyrhizobium cosmicum]QDP26161.1 hypothetical protein FNV92_30115 [Bradyrhizobium cosmicum]